MMHFIHVLAVATPEGQSPSGTIPATPVVTPFTISQPTNSPPTIDDVTYRTGIQKINQTTAFQNTYRPGISKYKKAILDGIQDADERIRAIVMAMAMQEDSGLSTRTDANKTQNFGLFNLNRLAIEWARPGVPESDYKVFNDFSSDTAIFASHKLMAGIVKDGANKDVTAFLNFVRGGMNGYKSTGKWDCDFDCRGYRANIASSAYMIIEDPKFLTDDRRIDAMTVHQ